MNQHYMVTYYPGVFVAETSERTVKYRIHPKKCPEGAYAVQFFDREEKKVGSEVLKGPKKHFSPTYFWGKEYTAAEVLSEFATEKILCSNVEGNGYKRLVRTVRGNWVPLGEKDVVIAP